MDDASKDLESRVLMMTPTPNDGEFTRKLFASEGIAIWLCHSLHEISEETKRGAGMLVLASDLVDSNGLKSLDAVLKSQPAWSEVPVLILVSSKSGDLQFSEQLNGWRGVTFVKRPVEVVALLTAVKSGLRDRSRQYAVREHLIERERHEQALLAADRRKDEFLATLAHELRNPLSPLRSGIDLLKMEDDDNPDRKAILQMMDRQLHQMVRLVDDLLDVSRITRDKLNMAAEVVEIQSVIKASIEMTRQPVNNSQMTLKSEMPLEPVFVQGDHARLTQVVSNLLSNAVKYSHDSSEIELSVKIEGEQILICVKDFGIGIPQSMLDKVFDMFTQVDSSITRSRGGLGIGLTLVRRIVEMHGGTVSATSGEKGQGSTFVVRLPRLRVNGTPTMRLSEIGKSKPRKVLVVDDTRAARLMLSKLLRKLGHEVHEAQDAQTALTMFDQVCPDIVISDIGMPEMDGYELARCIRARHQRHESYLVALTGYGQEADRRRALEAGFDTHLIKPVNISLLQRTLAECHTSS